MSEHTFKFWLAFAASCYHVYRMSHDRPMPTRLAIVAISAALGYSLYSDLSIWTGLTELLVLVLVTVVSYYVLEALSIVVADRSFLQKLIKARLKGK